VNSGSLRVRTTLATVGVLVLALAGFATAVTLRYRNGLESDLRSHLLAGARALQQAPADAAKQIQVSLALEGVNASIAGASPPVTKPGASTRRPPAKPASITSHGRLLVLTEPLGGTRPYAFATLAASQASVTGPVQRLIIVEIIGGTIVLAIATGLMLLGLRTALNPLAHVAQVAHSIAAGDRSLRLEPRRVDTELGRMAASFDAMVDALEDAAAQARRSESAMRRFLADASHELRTPVAALQATIETLLREQPQRPERDRLEAQVARDSARLGRLIDDLLNLARLEANEPLRSQPVDLAKIARSVVDDAAARPDCPGITFADDGSASVLGDPEALGRAIRNLLDNAILASANSGTIEVDIRGSASQVAAAITDNGPGVPVEERERIFEGFVRLPSATGSGTGLGLAIAREIARQHHGDITCEDATRGARFVLRLPAHTAP
jgi:signal transduction histidine kinase